MPPSNTPAALPRSPSARPRARGNHPGAVADPALGESQYRTLFVDPGTGEIRGDLPTYGSTGALPLRTWISNLHRSLNLGEPGRIYSELAATWLCVIALGGLLLWIDRIRRRRTTTPKKARPASGRARTVWLHGTTGTILLTAFVFLSATGLTWSVLSAPSGL
jgi:uncharacterized iron-regulated membrane protein